MGEMQRKRNADSYADIGMSGGTKTCLCSEADISVKGVLKGVDACIIRVCGNFLVLLKERSDELNSQPTHFFFLAKLVRAARRFSHIVEFTCGSPPTVSKTKIDLCIFVFKCFARILKVRTGDGGYLNKTTQIITLDLRIHIFGSSTSLEKNIVCVNHIYLQ